ncbi:DUF6671 family protein, partial [Longimicrobium sp.]|uniref:DUF6671 family protein n=1 Tax=Longimicrobium sp. TaxID=2029185 RepID=UPI002E3613A6
ALELVGTWQTGSVARHQRRIRDLARLDEAARVLSFPSHGLVVFAEGGAEGGLTRVADGIVAWGPLREAVGQALDATGCARLANDFRAHVNPTRHAAIAAAAGELARRVTVRCPDCGGPGYGPVRVERGLPCGWCHAPTAGVRAWVDGCGLCGAERARPAAGRVAPPDTCSFCNPSVR